MPDITYNVASFTQAYRSYAVEQGNDIHASDVRTNQIKSDLENIAAVARANGSDVLFISPEAARMYAEQLRQQKTVQARPRVENRRNVARATARQPRLQDGDARDESYEKSFTDVSERAPE